MTDTQTTHPSLLLRLRDERDTDSWSQFIAIYSPLIRGFLRKRGLQDADSADLTQEVLARVATAIKQFDYSPERGSFRGWLFTIVGNCLRRFSDQDRLGRQGSGDTQILHALAQHPAKDLQQEWDVEYQRHLLGRAAHEVRGDFQASTWRAFWNTAVEGRSPQEVAVELGISVASVYMAKHRIIERLRQHIRYLDGGPS
jgi:RNA polymerase sigma factor (sigma-70 family)